MIEQIQPSSVPQSSAPLSAGIKIDNLLFLSGQGPLDIAGARVGSTFAEQARATFDNLERVAQEAGTSLKNALRIGAYITSLDYIDEFNTVMAEYVSAPYPARTTIPVALRGFDVEIDAIVFVPESQ
jgi:reactive intermediate/imine deaminase